MLSGADVVSATYRESVLRADTTKRFHDEPFSHASENSHQQGCYYHELFLRGHPNLTGYMRRVGAPKGIDRRKIKTLEGDDPNLYEFPALKG
jgi:hypothetical protein